MSASDAEDDRAVKNLMMRISDSISEKKLVITDFRVFERGR